MEDFRSLFIDRASIHISLKKRRIEKFLFDICPSKVTRSRVFREKIKRRIETIDFYTREEICKFSINSRRFCVNNSTSYIQFTIFVIQKLLTRKKCLRRTRSGDVYLNEFFFSFFHCLCVIETIRLRKKVHRMYFISLRSCIPLFKILLNLFNSKLYLTK